MYVHSAALHHAYMKRVTPNFRRRQQYRTTFIRQWREARGLTLEQLAERIGTTHASLSRIERGKQPYTQPMLEAIADALGTDAASLIMRDPLDAEGIWSVWDQAEPGERRMIVDLARTVIKTGTRGG